MKSRLLLAALTGLLVVIILLSGCPTIDKPPKLTIPDKTVDEGQVLQFDLKQYAKDKDKNTLVFTIVYGVGEIIGSDYRYAPTFDDYGKTEVMIRVTNVKGKSAEDEFRITVGTVVVGEMVLVERGTFTMGDEFGDLWRYDCSPVHQVTLTYDFHMGKYEVTFDEYDTFCSATGRSKPRDQGWGRGQRPVINVSWWDAIAYCNWLSQKEGLPVAYRLLGEASQGQMLDANGNVTTDITKVIGYRLPTEAEWEYAARGGKHHSPYKYSGSDNVAEVAWYTGDFQSGWKTYGVGMKRPNALRIYDMSGNVREWCSDWWYYYTETPKTNPYNSTAGSYRVHRGGDFGCSVVFLRVAYRSRYSPTYTGYYLGFRICRTVP